MTNNSSYDILIKGGRLYDGSGSSPYTADIGIRGKTIAAIQGSIDERTAGKTIRAEGLAVGPGFLDAHSHDDLYLLIKPACDEKILQGVTTIVVGNCGSSAAPASEAFRTLLADATQSLGSAYIPEERRFFPRFRGLSGRVGRRRARHQRGFHSSGTAL